MPVFFYIDPDFVNDPNMKGIEQVTLSYTFFSKSCMLVLCFADFLLLMNQIEARYDKNGHLTPMPVGA